MTLVLSLAIAAGCRSVAGYDPVPPPPDKDAGADATPADTGSPDVVRLDIRSGDTMLDPSDLSGIDGRRDGPVEGPTIGDSSVDASTAVDATLDQSSPDLEVDGPTLVDATADQGAPPRVDITEIFPWALAVTDERGEWFELFNPGPGEVSLLNWRIVVSRSLHTITADVRIPRYGYAVLGVNGKASQNGGVDVDYEYGTVIRLDNENPERIRIERPDGSVADEVNFDVVGWGFLEGQALSYIGGDKNNSGSWCGEMMQWLPPSSDYGTPGAPRGCGL